MRLEAIGVSVTKFISIMHIQRDSYAFEVLTATSCSSADDATQGVIENSDRDSAIRSQRYSHNLLNSSGSSVYQGRVNARARRGQQSTLLQRLGEG